MKLAALADVQRRYEAGEPWQKFPYWPFDKNMRFVTLIKKLSLYLCVSISFQGEVIK
jgi:hypothetical protein